MNKREEIKRRFAALGFMDRWGIMFAPAEYGELRHVFIRDDGTVKINKWGNKTVYEGRMPAGDKGLKELLNESNNY